MSHQDMTFKIKTWNDHQCIGWY